MLNSGEITASGINVRARANWKTGPYDTGIDLHWLHQTRNDVTVAGLPQPGDFPRHRVQALLHAGRSGVNFSYTLHAISGYSNATETGKFDGWLGHDIAVRWRDAFGVKGLTMRGGVLNLTDEGPPVDSVDPTNAAVTDDSVRGRTFHVSIAARW